MAKKNYISNLIDSIHFLLLGLLTVMEANLWNLEVFIYY